MMDILSVHSQALYQHKDATLDSTQSTGDGDTGQGHHITKVQWWVP